MRVRGCGSAFDSATGDCRFNKFGFGGLFRYNCGRGRGLNCGFHKRGNLHRRGLGYRLGWGIGVQRVNFGNFGVLGVGRGFRQRLLKLRRRL